MSQLSEVQLGAAATPRQALRYRVRPGRGLLPRPPAITVSRLLATTLDVSDLSQVAKTQPHGAMTAKNVVFVDMRLPGAGLCFFRSKSPVTDWELRTAYDEASVAAFAEHRFVLHDDRSALYRQAASGVSHPGVKARLPLVAKTILPDEQMYQMVRAVSTKTEPDSGACDSPERRSPWAQ